MTNIIHSIFLLAYGLSRISFITEALHTISKPKYADTWQYSFPIALPLPYTTVEEPYHIASYCLRSIDRLDTAILHAPRIVAR